MPQEMLQSISATRKGEATATDNLQALAYSINMTTGCSVDFVAGPIEVTGRDGQTRYVNGFFDPEARRIVVRVDSGRYTPQQIAKHEEFHVLAKIYPKLIKVVRDNVLQRYGRMELRNIIRTYQEKRRGINDIRSGNPDLFSQEAEELLEEIFADANGRMNAFDAGAERYWADTRKGIADQQDRAFRERQKAAATDRWRGPPKYMIDEDGRTITIKFPAYTAEQMKQNAIQLQSMDSVKTLSGNEFSDHSKTLFENVLDFFDSLGNNVFSEEFGDVALKRSSVRSDIRHGNTHDKIVAYAAIPEVIQNGMVIDSRDKGGGLERIVTAAPVHIGGKKYYMGVMLQRDPTSQRLYAHDVITTEEPTSSADRHLSTNRAGSDGDKLFITDILQKAISVKAEPSGTIVDNEDPSGNAELEGADTGGAAPKSERETSPMKYSVSEEDDGIISLAEQNDPAYNDAIAPCLEEHHWPENFPPAMAITNLKGLKSDAALHAAAKRGDQDAADRLVKRVAKPERMQAFAESYKDALLVPVWSVQERQNMLPFAYAAELVRYGMKLELGITQIQKGGHTAASGIHRLMSHNAFEGDVVPGQTYVLVDDVLTFGGTLNDLRMYIESKGGKVVATTVLATGQSGKWLAARPELVQDIYDKYGEERINNLLRKAGIAYDAASLTDRQARYILRVHDYDTLRDRISEERVSAQHGGSPSDRTGTLGERGRGESGSREGRQVSYPFDSEEDLESFEEESAPDGYGWNEEGIEDPKLQQAIEMVRAGAEPSEVFNGTGYVRMANGNLIDPNTGEIVWRNDNGSIRETEEIPAQREKTGESEAGTPEDDGRGTAGLDRERVSESRDWSTLTGNERRTVTGIVANHIKVNANSELSTLQSAYGGQNSLAAELYKRYLQGRALYENDDLVQFIPNAGDLYDQIDRAMNRDAGEIARRNDNGTERGTQGSTPEDQTRRLSEAGASSDDGRGVPELYREEERSERQRTGWEALSGESRREAERIILEHIGKYPNEAADVAPEDFPSRSDFVKWVYDAYTQGNILFEKDTVGVLREPSILADALDRRLGTQDIKFSVTEEQEPEGLRVGAAEEPAAEPSEGARRRLEEKRQTEKEIERARKKGPQRKTKLPDYNPVSADSGKNFREIAGEIRSRAAAERAKRMEHVSKEKFFGTEALQKLGVKIEGALGNYTGTKQLREAERAAKQLKSEIRRQEKILNATDKEKQMARGMAAGVYTMEDFGPNVLRGVVEALADYYEYERTINDDMVLQRRRDINTQLDDQIQEMLPDDPGYKIPPMFVLNHRTPERICRNIWGDEKGQEVYEKFFRPVAVNEAEKIRFVKKQFDDVREIEGSDGRKSELTRDEAMLAQQVLEGRAAAELVAGMELEDGRERIEAVAENIVNGDDAAASARENGLSDQERGIAEQYARWLQTKAIYDSGAFDTVKIDNAVEIYQEKYNLMYDAINDFLVAHGYKPIGFIRGYAPHMQMQEDLNVFARYLKSLGINDDVTRLPANIAGRTADLKPNKRWNPYFLHRSGDLTDFDIAKGFQSYVTYMADVLYHTDDTMRIRALSRHYRALYAPDNIRENLDWAKYMNSASPEVKREEMQKRGILSRDAAVSEEEVNDAFDRWIEEQFESIKDTTKYSDLVMYLDNYANILAGKQSMSDRGGEYDWGRESLTRANRLISAFARTQVAGNLSSAFSQLSQIPMIQAELGPKFVAQAVRDYANGTLKKAGFAQQSDHLTERAGSGALVTDRYDMVMDKLFNPLRLVDGFTASIAVRAKYLQQIEAGRSHEEALKEADAYAKRVQGSRAKGSKPLAFHSKKAVNQALHLFQLELFNSWEHVSQDLPADFREIEREHGRQAAAGALAKVILSYLMTAFLLNRLTEETYGGTPAPFDLLGITSNFIASGYGLTTNAYLETIMDNVMQELFDKRIFETDPEKMRDKFKVTDASEGAWYEIGSDIPFLRNVMGLMGMGDQTLPIPLMGLGDELKYLVKDVRSDIENGKLSGQTGMDLLHIMNQMLPGGRQLTKTAEGLQLMQQGGRYVNGKLYYPVENSVGNWAKAVLFGRSALEESDAYYAGDDHALSVGATELYKMLTDQGSVENREAYEALQKAKNLNDDQTEWLRGYGKGGGDTWTAWQTMQQYKAADNDKTTGSLEKGKQTRAAITNAVLTDKERLELYRVMDKGNEGKADKLETIMGAGLSWAEAVQVYDAYAEIEANGNLSKKEQAEQWASWVNRQNYTDTQKDTIRDAIKFWGSYAIEDTTVDKMNTAGLDPDAADMVTAILNGLQPEAGRDKVTDLQKYKAITGSGLSEKEQWQAIIGLTPESYTSTLDKITVMQDYGISPEVWTKSKQAMYDADDAGNNNDSTDQKEAKAALDGMDIPKDQKAILWQLTNKSWSWKKNPYDTDIGQEVYALIHDGDTGKGGTSKKKSGKRGGGRRGGRGGKKAGGGLEVGAAFDSGHSGMFDSVLLGWKRKKYSRSQILAMVKAGILTQEEAEEILGTLQDEEIGAVGDGLTLGEAEG